VLTVGNASCNKLDWSSFEEIRDVRVFRTYQLEPSIRRLVKHKKDFEETIGFSRTDNHQEGLIKKFKNWIIHNLLIPDPNIGWLPFGVRRALEICKQEKIDVLFSTAPPLTAHAIGLVTKRITGLPWVADFRDPWSLAPHFNPYAAGFKRVADRWVENQIYKHADRCIFVGEYLIQKTLEAFSDLSPEQCIFLPNGFDNEDFDYSIPADLSRIRITYAGRLASGRSLDFFLQCVKKVLEAKPKYRDVLRLEFVGELDDHNRSILSGFRFPEILQIHGILPMRVCNRLLCASNVHLAIIPAEDNRYGATSSKVFNSIGCRRPILLVSPPGEAARFITENRLGFHLNAEDPPGAPKSLMKILSSGLESFTPNEEVINLYERRNQARQLAGLLDAVIRNSGLG
jgi:glycosyltransferase involved in cell wall biosynthesis